MKFRNYCVVIMGNTTGVVPEIDKVSESKPNILDAKGIVIGTFTSFMEPNELSEWFKSNDRSFLVFDLNLDNSAVLIEIIDDGIKTGFQLEIKNILTSH